MASSSSSSLFLSACVSSFFLLLISSPAHAFNITKILEDYPDFGTFNSLLTQSKLAAEINSRSTITVLAVNNGAAGGLSGKPEDELKRILSVHVVLDYYDEEKLTNLKKKSTLLTTLFQSSGIAVNQQGFLNVTKDKSGEVRVGSAVPGAGLTATIVKEVTTQPFNISVLEVSGIIYPTGIDQVNSTAAPAAAPPTKAAGAPATTPAASPKGSAAETPEASAPSSEASEAPAPGADAPTDDSDAPAPSDAPSSAADGAPAGSDAPGSDAPGTDAPGSDASSPGPSSDDSADSSASRAAVTLLAVVAGVISMLVAN